MNLILNKILKLIFLLLYSNRSLFNKVSSKAKEYRNTIYSKKYCFLFNCQKVSFYYPINLAVGTDCFKIGEKTYFGKMAVLTAWKKYGKSRFEPQISIGERCGFNDYLHLSCINQINIGNGVRVGRWVTITDNSHGEINYANLQLNPHDRELFSKGPIIIEDNVWIGDKCTILPGVTIGEGSVIGANTVVTKNIPPYSIVAGNPAKIIKQVRQ